jgi:hypothetical protein
VVRKVRNNMVISFDNNKKDVSPLDPGASGISRGPLQCNMKIPLILRSVKHFYCTAT